MGDRFQLYVKATSNCGGMELQGFEQLGPEWSGPLLALSFGEGDERRTRAVVGWGDLFDGTPCEVHVAQVRLDSGHEGALV